jgi:hypothetical protein
MREGRRRELWARRMPSEGVEEGEGEMLPSDGEWRRTGEGDAPSSEMAGREILVLWARRGSARARSREGGEALT